MNKIKHPDAAASISAITEAAGHKKDSNKVARKLGNLTRLFGAMAIVSAVAGCEREDGVSRCLPDRFELIEDIKLSHPYSSYVRDPQTDICYYASNSCSNAAILTSVPCEKLKKKDEVKGK